MRGATRAPSGEEEPGRRTRRRRAERWSVARVTVFRDGASPVVEDGVDQLRSLLDDDRTVVWVDLPRGDVDAIEAVGAALHLHPLAVEDALNGSQRTKLDE